MTNEVMVAERPQRMPAMPLLEMLELRFFEELSAQPYVLWNRHDDNATVVLQLLLHEYVRAKEQEWGPDRRFGDKEAALARAHKAAELLSKVPRHRVSNKDFTYEWCSTRRLLWETLLDGLMSVSLPTYSGIGICHDYMPEVGEALLHWGPLSDNERATFEKVLRERFEKHQFECTEHLRYLMFQTGQVRTDPKLKRSMLHAMVRHASDFELDRLSEAVGLNWQEAEQAVGAETEERAEETAS